MNQSLALRENGFVVNEPNFYNVQMTDDVVLVLSSDELEDFRKENAISIKEEVPAFSLECLKDYLPTLGIQFAESIDPKDNSPVHVALSIIPDFNYQVGSKVSILDASVMLTCLMLQKKVIRTSEPKKFFKPMIITS